MKRSALMRLTKGIFVISAVAMLALPAGASGSIGVSPRLKPPAPGPEHMSRIDHTRILSISEGLKRKEYASALGLAETIEDPIANSLAMWLYYKASDPNVNLQKADAFLDAHPDWPMISRIQSGLEEDIKDSTPVDLVLSFFDNREPVSGDGKIQFARALLSRGEQDKAETYLRDAWINDNFSVSQERRILSNYGRRLTEDDHAARVDRLLWSRQVTNARRIFSELSSSERKKAEARAALLLGASSGPSAYARLSEEDQMDSGVLLAAVRYYRRTEDERFAIALADQSPKNPEILRNSSAWWYERQLLMRWALKEGRFEDAYIATSNHGLEPGGSFAEAEFNAGWIALRFLDDPARAKTHFLALASAVQTPISISRAYYWLGRAASANNEPALATSYYQTAAKHYYSYYGQLAAEELGGAALQQKFDTASMTTAEERAMFHSRPTVAALRMLSDLNLDYEFMVFAYHIDDQLERQGEYIELAKLTNGEGAPHLTVRAGKMAIQKGAFAPDVAYPLVFVPDEASRYVPHEMILGLSRQESEFNPRAYSRAGARGMMQLIPETALITARKEGLTYSRSALLDDPIYNMTLGSAHLSHLLDRFDGSLIMTFAAYNAGPHRATRWATEYGDPRSPAVDPVDWVELIPFSETRNYVQRVLENMQVYRGRLNNAPIPGRLSLDLERGGPEDRAAALETPSVTLANAGKDRRIKPLPPVPMATSVRARRYELSRTSLRVKPVTAETTMAPAPQPVTTPEHNAQPATSSGSAPEIDRAKTLNETNTAQTAPVAESVAVTVPEPVATAEDISPAMKEILDSGAGSAPEPVANIDAATPENMTIDAAAESPAASAPPWIADAIADRIKAVEEAERLRNSGAIERDVNAPISEKIVTTPATGASSVDVEPGAAAPEYTAPEISETPEPDLLTTETVDADIAASNAFDSDANDGVVDACLTYRAFLAENAEDDAEAQDLNAGMLAELRGGGNACD